MLKILFNFDILRYLYNAKKNLEMVDIFGKKFNFTVFYQKYHKTSFGGVLSLLTVLCTVLITLFFGRDFFYRLNPSYTVENVELSLYPNYQVDSSNLVYGFRLVDKNGNYIKESSFFNFAVIYNQIQIIKNSNGKFVEISNKIKLNFTKCTIEREFRKIPLPNLIETIDYKNFYYIEFSNQILIGGYWNSNFTNYIDVQLTFCNKNETKCRSGNQSAYYLSKNKLYLNILTLKNNIDTKNYSNPLYNSLSYLYVQIEPKFSKKINVYMSHIKFLSNNGWLVDNIINYQSFNMDY